jgi:hypothetical protein
LVLIGIIGWLIGFAIIVAIVAYFVVFWSAATLGPQFIQLRYGPVKDASAVSGFYGPGSYLGWQLTAAVTAVQYLSSDKKPAKPDPAGFAATLAYAGVAAGDALLRAARSTAADAQLDAALAACHFALVVSAMCILGALAKDRRTRKRGWWLLFGVAAVPAAVWDLGGYRSVFGLFRLCWTVFVAGCGCITSTDNRGNFVAISLPTMGLFLIFMMLSPPSTFEKFPDVPYVIEYAFPRSQAKFSDMDQFAVLIAWGLGSAYVVLPGRLRRSIMKSTPVTKIRALFRSSSVNTTLSAESSSV